MANIRTFAHLIRRDLGTSARLISRSGGYELSVPPEECDHFCFVELALAGGNALSLGDPVKAADVLESALALWVGDHAAIGVPRNGPLNAWLGHLDEERMRVEEDLAEAYLHLGEVRGALRGLKEHLAAAPIRGRSLALCMRGYQMLGELHNVADVYQQAAAAQYRDLGVPLDHELSRLYQEIMRDGASNVIAARRPGRR